MFFSGLLRARGQPARAAWALCLGAGLTLVACGGATASPQIPQGRIFPAYGPADTIIFDDVLAPALFGFDPEGRNPATDPKLRERTRLADYVLPAKVVSISRVGGVANEGSFEVTVMPTGPALAGDHEGPVTLTIPVTGPTYAWVSGAGASFAGKHLILLAREYRDGDGSVLHFRGEPDTPAVRQAITKYKALRLLK